MAAAERPGPSSLPGARWLSVRFTPWSDMASRSTSARFTTTRSSSASEPLALLGSARYVGRVTRCGTAAGVRDAAGPVVGAQGRSPLAWRPRPWFRPRFPDPIPAGLAAAAFGAANGWTDAVFYVLAMEASDPRMAASTYALFMAVTNISVAGGSLFARLETGMTTTTSSGYGAAFLIAGALTLLAWPLIKPLRGPPGPLEDKVMTLMNHVVPWACLPWCLSFCS